MTRFGIKDTIRRRGQRALGALAALVVAAMLASCGADSSAQTSGLDQAVLADIASPSSQVTASQVAFGSVTKGWLALSASIRYQQTSALEVMGTSDGGASWNSQLAVKGSPIDLVDLGNNDVWLSLARSVTCTAHMSNLRCQKLNARGALFRTSNGGTSWRQVWSGAGQLAQVVMTGPQTGFAISKGLACPVPQTLGKPPPSCPGLVVATSDGGSRWRPVLRTNGPVLALASEGRTWLALQNTVSLYGTKPKSPPAQLVLWASSDFGHHWAKRSEIAPNLLSTYLGVDNEASLITVGRQGLVVSLVDRDLCGHACGSASWASTDAGRQWRYLPLSPLPGHFCGPDGMPIWGATSGQNPSPVLYMAANPAVNACAPPVAALERLDHGTWHQVHLWQAGFVTAQDWPSTTNGYAIVSGALARTTDRGRTWQQGWPSPMPSGPLALSPGDRALGAVEPSSGGAVLESADGGKRWSQRADLAGTVSAIAATSAGAAVVALDQPFLDRWVLEGTTDGGSRWSVFWSLPTRARSVDNQGISGLWMEPKGDGLMLTTTGTGPDNSTGVGPAALWLTKDDGHQWREVANVPTNTDWVSGAMAFYLVANGSWHGFVQGGSRTMVTDDTGRHWHLEPRWPLLMQAQYVSAATVAGWQLGPKQQPWLWVSTDGGRQWDKRPLPPQGQPDVAGHGALQFSGHGVGLWSQGDEVWATSALGYRWQRVDGD